MPELNPKELKILNAAQTLFHRHGFKRVTMHDIAVDARELIECSHGFARAALDEITAEFETIVRGIFAEVAPPRNARFNAGALAHLLVASIHGFKTAASDVDDLRDLIARQIAVMLAAVAGLAAAERKEPA